MILRQFRTPAAIVIVTALLASTALAQTRPTAPESPYGGTTVEEIIARINDQVISRSDYDRAMKELDQDARSHNALPQDIASAHKDLLRNLIDQQLWLSKGKELGINGETELVGQLNEIRKQYNLETLEDLEKAARDQGVSYEDFKANIRNSIITREVMRQEVGRHLAYTPGELQRYWEQHKQDYAQQESVSLAEILVSTGTPAPSATEKGATEPDDPAKLAAAKAKADEIEAKLHAGGDFGQLARTFSDGSTASSGGDLGKFKRGSLAKVIEDATFALKSGQFTEPIRTKQGYVILKVAQHIAGGIPELKDVQPQVEETFFMARMEPAIRQYLTKMREDAFIDVKPGFADTGASARQTKPVYSAYTPPAPKKKKKVERTRFRETPRSFRQKGHGAAAEPVAAPAAAPAPAPATPEKKAKKTRSSDNAMKLGKREKIRLGKAPTKTLPAAAEAQTQTEDAGAVSKAEQAASAAQEPANPLENNAEPERKTRFSARPKAPKTPKNTAGGPVDPQAPAAPDAAEVADRQTQAGPLGLAGDTASKKKKKATATGDKTRLAQKKKTDKDATGDQPLAPAQTPAPQSTPQPAPQK